MALVNITPSATTINIPIQVTGNTQPGDGRTYTVAVKAVSAVSSATPTGY
jgi:hypothetical protein